MEKWSLAAKVVAGVSFAAGFAPEITGAVFQITNSSSNVPLPSNISLSTALYSAGGSTQTAAVIVFVGTFLYDYFTMPKKEPILISDYGDFGYGAVDGNNDGNIVIPKPDKKKDLYDDIFGGQAEYSHEDDGEEQYDISLDLNRDPNIDFDDSTEEEYASKILLDDNKENEEANKSIEEKNLDEDSSLLEKQLIDQNENTNLLTASDRLTVSDLPIEELKQLQQDINQYQLDNQGNDNVTHESGELEHKSDDHSGGEQISTVSLDESHENKQENKQDNNAT